MTRLLLVLAGVALVMTSLAGAQSTFPDRIDLPDGFQPEGITTRGEQFYVGSIPTGAVYRGSLRTGEGALLVQPQTSRAAIGMKVDRGRLFVAGGNTGSAYVYDARTGALVRTYALVDRRQLHQRRRRDQKGCVVHRLVEAGPVSRTPGPRGAAWSGQGLQHREPHG